MTRTTPEFLEHLGPIAYAHRGGNIVGTERQNTMVAFQAAYDLGYRYFETDVICSADGQVVISHGSRSRRDESKTGLPRRAWLQSMTYEEITKRVSAGGEQIPLLEEVLAAFSDVKLNIEPKTREAVVPLGNIIADWNIIDRVCVASFRYVYTKAVVEQIRERKGRSRQVCTAAGPAGSLAVAAGLSSYVRSAGFDCLQLPHRQTTARIVERAHDMDLKIHVWTPNDESSMVTSLEKGVDGIMSDEILLLKDVMDCWDQT